MKLLNVDGAFVEYWLALVLTTVPETSGNSAPVSKFVQVREASAVIGLKVVSAGDIVGCVHEIPETVTSSKPGN
jgi:hypothetical protein